MSGAATPKQPTTTAAAEHAPFLEPVTRRARVLILLALIVLPQLVLYGPSIFGARVLLPLDLLKTPGLYSPMDANAARERPIDHILSDLVYELEPERVYAVEAVRSGRIPLWSPLNYSGTPFLAANHTSVFYPLRVIDYLWPGPISVAWVQLAKSLLAGIGAYLFLRRVTRVAFWPAAVAAAVWPNVGFLVLWAGFTISQVGAHLPWMLLAADETIRKPRSLWPAALALATAIVLVSGHASIAAHVLLATGLYALFRLWDVHGFAGTFAKRGLGAIGALVLGWTLGALLSGPQSIPTLDYMRESLRIANRMEGKVETNPVGLAGVPSLVMPYVDGSSQRHTVLTVHANRLESSPAAYAGMLALLVLAPLGFLARRHLRFQFFWLALGFLGVSALLGVPLVEKVFELPGLNTLRNNRFTLVSAWATVAMLAAGLDVLVRGQVRWSRWSWIPVALLGVLACAAWFRYSAVVHELAGLEETMRAGKGVGRPPLDTFDGVERVQKWFLRVSIGYTLLVGVCLAAWYLLRKPWGRTPRAAALLGVFAIAEVTAQGYDCNVQAPPELYYPRVAALEKLASLPPGRMVGYSCLPACLNQSHGLVDLRGYDATDPARMVEFLDLFRNKQCPPGPNYAAVQSWYPQLPHGLATLANLRYVLVFGPPDPRAMFQSGGFQIHEYPGAPRAFFARSAQLVNDKSERLALLAKDTFDPRAVVLLESDAPLPADAAPADGDAEITSDEPERVAISVNVRASGWLVLSDRWTNGWKARVDGVELPVLQADHVYRAVHLAPGAREVVFTYEPKSWRQGLVAGALGALALAAWCAVSVLWARRGAPNAV